MSATATQFAIVVHGGQQHLVTPGQTIQLATLPGKPGEAVSFDQVLLVGGDQVKVGTPVVNGAKVTGSIVAHGKTKKVTGVKFHNKVRYRRTFGHRQAFTSVKIEKITA